MRLRVLRPLALSYRCSVLRVPPSQANLTIADPRRRHALHRGRCPRLYPGIVEGSWPKKKRPPVRRGLALFIAGQGHQSARRGRSRAALVRHYCSLLMSMSLTESSSTEKSTATMVASLPITTAAWLAILARRWRTRRRQPHALDSRFRFAQARQQLSSAQIHIPAWPATHPIVVKPSRPMGVCHHTEKLFKGGWISDYGGRAAATLRSALYWS